MSPKPQSPFLDISSFPAEELEVIGEQEAPSAWYEAESPFQSIYKLEETEIMLDPEAEEFVSFLAELYDQEFDGAILELVNEATVLYEAHFEGEAGRLGTRSVEAERLLEEHFAPLIREAEALFDAMAQGTQDHDLRTMTDSEIEMLLNQFEPNQPQLAPVFEDFLKKLWKKAKKTVKKVASTAKKVGKAVVTGGMSLVWPKLKRLVKPLLARVLKMAIGKLPHYLRPVARGLAKRYLGRYLKEVEEETVFQECEDATMDVAEIQQEYDLLVAQLVYADDEVEQEAMLAEVLAESEQPAADPLREFERARAYFIQEIMQLEDEQEPSALLENFLPALLPVLKLGFKFVGRDKVVKFLAKHVAKLVRRFVGRKYARPLSRAVVDLGLKYFGLEVTDEEAHHAAGEAVAYTVEETMRQISALPDYVLEDEELLEGEVIKAFESAAAAYLPPILSENVYYERPELQEATSVKGFWTGLPLRGRKRYRKFTGRFPTLKIKPHTIRRIKTWRGRPLAAHLRNQRRVHVGRPLEAQIHLYEAMPGTSLADISRFEKNVQGLGTAQESAWSHLHPLTPEAAGLLTGETGLGRDVPPQHLDDPIRPPAVGQRFYYLEIREAQPQTIVMPGGTPMPRQPSEVNLVMNFSRDWIQVFIFLSEMKAQELAAKLRQRASAGIVLTMLKAVYESAVRAALTGGMHRRVKVVHSAIAPEQSDGQALRWLPQIIREKLEEKLLEWLGHSLSAHFRQQAQSFITATEDSANGVTVIVTLSNPSGLPKMRRVLGGEPVVLRSKWFSDERPDAKLQIVPGYQRE